MKQSVFTDFKKEITEVTTDTYKFLEADVSTPEKWKYFAEHKPRTAEVIKLLRRTFEWSPSHSREASVNDFFQNLSARTITLHRSPSWLAAEQRALRKIRWQSSSKSYPL